ncbi:MAG: pseudouridine synthase [Bacteroidales bacterium]|nr:pseudouridine synthase [Bacteroidales bacterium]
MNKKDNSGKRPRIVKVTVKKPAESRPYPSGEGSQDRKPARSPRVTGDSASGRRTYTRNDSEDRNQERTGYPKRNTDDRASEKPGFTRKSSEGKPFERKGPQKKFNTREGGDSRNEKSSTERQPSERRPTERRSSERQPSERRPTERRSSEQQPSERRPTERRSSERQPSERRPTERRSSERQPSERRPSEKRPTERTDEGKFSARKNESRPKRDYAGDDERPSKRSYTKRNDKTAYPKPKRNADVRARRGDSTGLIRLNKYLADAGVCSRREADDLIKAGVVSVNGKIVAEVGTKVKPEDKVVYGGQTLSREKLRYILLNKPKGYITTSDDPFERKTVMELVAGACTERIYPVGRLDRNTLGLLLFTNDGELAKKMMHPRYGVKKLYHVELDKPLTKADLLKIAEGVELEDGVAEVDKISWVSADESKKEVGIEIHSGKNRIVRRIFESLDYKVVKLDRVIFGGLTKLNLNRGRWRHLTPKEIGMLKSLK